MRGLGIPAPLSDGPIARSMTRLGDAPRAINPAIRTSSPNPTWRRVEIFARRLPVTVGIGCATNSVWLCNQMVFAEGAVS